MMKEMSNITASIDNAFMESIVTVSNVATIDVMHYAALPPTRKIEEGHVHQVLGVGNHTDEAVQKKLNQLVIRKKDVRTWAGQQIKSKMTQLAQQLGLTIDGYPVRSFLDIKRWWSKQDIQRNREARQNFFLIAYGFFEQNKDWDVHLEAAYMKTNNFAYCEESKARLQKSNGRRGYKVKGCIARNIVMVKHELVKQFQKSGRTTDDGVTITKNRPKTKSPEGARRKQGVFYCNNKENMAPIEVVTNNTVQ
jgi:hypothetical protein